MSEVATVVYVWSDVDFGDILVHYVALADMEEVVNDTMW